MNKEVIKLAFRIISAVGIGLLVLSLSLHFLKTENVTLFQLEDYGTIITNVILILFGFCVLLASVIFFPRVKASLKMYKDNSSTNEFNRNQFNRNQTHLKRSKSITELIQTIGSIKADFSFAIHSVENSFAQEEFKKRLSNETDKINAIDKELRQDHFYTERNIIKSMQDLMFKANSIIDPNSSKFDYQSIEILRDLNTEISDLQNQLRDIKSDILFKLIDENISKT